MRNLFIAAGLIASITTTAQADDSFARTVREVNPKVVKIYGAGGFRGVTAYCTGILVSPQGHILTVYSSTLDTQNLRVHLFDGTRHPVKRIAVEPQLEAALLKIETEDGFEFTDLPHFDLANGPPVVEPGDWILGFSNLFEIATGGEPVSVQHGVVAHIGPLTARRGVREAAYKGTAYVVDAITNNPGAHGGAVTTRKGELIGIIGRELRNTQTETWINYAIPIGELVEFVNKARSGRYQPIVEAENDQKNGKPVEHGLVLVPDVLEETPPYVEEARPGSPAARAGLRPDDLIITLRMPPVAGGNSFLISSCKAFQAAIARCEPGMKIGLTVRRGMDLLSVDLELKEPETR